MYDEFRQWLKALADEDWADAPGHPVERSTPWVYHITDRGVVASHQDGKPCDLCDVT